MTGVRVVKLGGNELERAGWLARCAQLIAQSTHPVVVVHGGGRVITELSARLGLPSDKRDGVRVTSPGIAAAVEMALGGPVNRQVVAALRREGVDALGLCGVDGGLLTAVPLEPDLGHVGRITEVRAALLHSLLLAGFTPVVAPMAPAARADAGPPLNVNADHAAAAIAGALGAAELLLVSDVAGVVVNGEVRPALQLSDVSQLVAAGSVHSGMVAKLDAAAGALTSGTAAVRIGDLELLTTPTAGTRVLATAARAA